MVAALLAVVAVTGYFVVRSIGGDDVTGSAVAGPSAAGAAVTSPAAPTDAAGPGDITLSTVTVTATRTPAPSPAGTASPADPGAYRGYALRAGEPVTVPANGAGGLYFSSPSGNIHCTIAPSGDGYAICSIDQKNWAGAPQPGSCRDNWLDNHVAVTASGVQSGQCLSGVAVPPVATVLPYGRTLGDGAVTCSSAETGVTCRHDGTGHGFTVRRDTLDTF